MLHGIVVQCKMLLASLTSQVAMLLQFCCTFGIVVVSLNLYSQRWTRKM